MQDFINWDAFSHGQIISKKWLCTELEPFLKPYHKIAILGGWYNVLAFMLRVRDNRQHITSFDSDVECKKIADKINNCWIIENSIQNHVSDANDIDLSDFDVIINTSCEHMSSSWFDNVKSGTLMCIQSSDLNIKNEPWYIINPSSDLTTFSSKFPLTISNFQSQIDFDYGDLKYKRFMIIGSR